MTRRSQLIEQFVGIVGEVARCRFAPDDPDRARVFRALEALETAEGLGVVSCWRDQLTTEERTWLLLGPLEQYALLELYCGEPEPRWGARRVVGEIEVALETLRTQGLWDGGITKFGRECVTQGIRVYTKTKHVRDCFGTWHRIEVLRFRASRS